MPSVKGDFRKTKRMRVGRTPQGRRAFCPHVSAQTDDWIISAQTLTELGGRDRAGQKTQEKSSS